MQVMRVRLSDIAARAGVSEATVSRALNDKPGVSAENRRAILATMERLGYERPSRPRTSGLVGRIVPELDATLARELVAHMLPAQRPLSSS